MMTSKAYNTTLIRFQSVISIDGVLRFKIRQSKTTEESCNRAAILYIPW